MRSRDSRLKVFLFRSFSLHGHLPLVQADLLECMTRCLTVTGGASVDFGRLSQPIWLLGALYTVNHKKVTGHL